MARREEPWRYWVDCAAWLWVSNSGTHYIKDSYGKIHTINKSWVRITITE